MNVVVVFCGSADVACDDGLEAVSRDGCDPPSLFPVTVTDLWWCKGGVVRFNVGDNVVDHCICLVCVVRLLLS